VVADGKLVSSNVSLLGAAAEGHDIHRGCFLFTSVCRGEPAWHLALDQLVVVGGDAVGDDRQWKMGRDSVEQELAEALPDFDLLALAMVGERIGDDRRVVFIDEVVLGVGGGKDDGSMHGYPGAEGGGGGYVLVVDQGFVDLMEGCIRDDLAGDVVSFSMGGSFGGGRGWEVAHDLALGLGVHGRDKLGVACFLPWVFFFKFYHPSTLVACVACSVGGCGWAMGVLAASAYVWVLVPLLVGGLLALYLFSVALFPFLFLSFFGLGPVLLGPPVGFAVAAGPCAAERSCCCIWVTRVPSVVICLVRLFVVIWKVVFWAKSTEISALMVLANWSWRLLVMISISARGATCAGLSGAAIWGAVLMGSSMSPSIAYVAVTCSVCWKSMALSSSSSLPLSSESLESESESESVSFSSRARFAGEGDREATTVGG